MSVVRISIAFLTVVYSIFLLFIFMMSLTMKAWFRALAAAFGAPASAQSVSGVALLAISLYTGYVIPRPSMIGALKWITWINVRSSKIVVF